MLFKLKNNMIGRPMIKSITMNGIQYLNENLFGGFGKWIDILAPLLSVTSFHCV
jgi:hypothetical protein